MSLATKGLCNSCNTGMSVLFDMYICVKPERVKCTCYKQYATLPVLNAIIDYYADLLGYINANC